MSNKAHTATLNRILHRYEVDPEHGGHGSFDVVVDGVIIEVETSASLPAAVERLKSVSGPVYIAVTNKEGIEFAARQVAGTSIGIMDPQGNVILASGEHSFPSAQVKRPE